MTLNLSAELILLIAGTLVFVSTLASTLSDRIGVPALLLFLAIGMLAGSARSWPAGWSWRRWVCSSPRPLWGRSAGWSWGSRFTRRCYWAPSSLRPTPQRCSRSCARAR